MTYPVRGFAGGAGRPAWPQPVIITTTGATFSPSVQVAAQNVTVTWTWAGGQVTGLNPVISFGSAGTRTVYMTAAIPGGYSALNQVTVFNVGYTYSNDTGTYSPPPSYGKAAQAVSALAGVSSMTGLQLFLAGGITGLTGPADFTGMSQLTNIECYGSRFTSFNVTGCTSLQRLVVEQDNLAAANVNPVLATLRELRLAAQQGSALTFSPAVSGPFPVLYHFCLRDQAVTGMPNLGTALPAVSELWIWNTGQSGTLAPSSAALTNVQAYGNSYTSANFAGLFVTGSTAYLDLHSNQLAACTLAGCTALGYVDLSGNLLTQSQVDGVLGVLAGTSVPNGTVNVGGTGNAAPSSAGLSSTTALAGRGWTVTHN